MMFRILAATSIFCLAVGHSTAQVATENRTASEAPIKEAARAESSDLEELERKFQQSLTGATLIGSFVETGKNLPGKLNPEKYSILGVKKVKPDHWEFRARIEYGEHDLTVPLTLPVYWAGDTPVITLDKIPVPGLGKFTARVMIYQDHYAGTWDGGDHGGLMFGRIERKAESRPDTP